MSQLIRCRNFSQLKSCVCFLNQISHQNSLPNLTSLTTELSRLFNNRQLNQLHHRSAHQNELVTRLNKSQQVRLIKKEANQIPKQEDHETILEIFGVNSKDSTFDPKIKSILKSNYDPDSNRPNRENLEEFYNYIERAFPKFFTEKINLTYFEQHVIIEDNQSGKTKKEVGYNSLISKISFIRIYYSLLYSHNLMNVLGMAKIPAEGLVKVRWRIVSMGKPFIFFMPWRFMEFSKKEYWNDGIVYFYLNKKGKVKKIVLDKVDRNKEEETESGAIEKMAKV